MGVGFGRRPFRSLAWSLGRAGQRPGSPVSCLAINAVPWRPKRLDHFQAPRRAWSIFAITPGIADALPVFELRLPASGSASRVYDILRNYQAWLPSFLFAGGSVT